MGWMELTLVVVVVDGKSRIVFAIDGSTKQVMVVGMGRASDSSFYERLGAHCTLARVGHGGYQHMRATRETPARAGCYNSRDHVDNYGLSTRRLPQLQRSTFNVQPQSDPLTGEREGMN